MFIMKLEPEYFEQIKSGEKFYEARINDEKRKKIRIGDTILFKKKPDLYLGVLTKVVDIRYFNTFFEMAQTLDIKGLGFDGKNAEGIKDTYYQFYSKEEEQEFGVVVFKLEVIN